MKLDCFWSYEHNWGYICTFWPQKCTVFKAGTQNHNLVFALTAKCTNQRVYTDKIFNLQLKVCSQRAWVNARRRQKAFRALKTEVLLNSIYNNLCQAGAGNPIYLISTLHKCLKYVCFCILWVTVNLELDGAFNTLTTEMCWAKRNSSYWTKCFGVFCRMMMSITFWMCLAISEQFRWGEL